MELNQELKEEMKDRGRDESVSTRTQPQKSERPHRELTLSSPEFSMGSLVGVFMLGFCLTRDPDSDLAFISSQYHLVSSTYRRARLAPSPLLRPASETEVHAPRPDAPLPLLDSIHVRNLDPKCPQ